MTIERLFWLSGLALAIGGGLATLAWLAFALFDPGHVRYQERWWLALNFMVIGGGLFMALGLPGFYARQAQAAGLLGLIGHLLLFAGIILAYVAVHAIETLTRPDVPARMMTIVSVAAPSLFLGGILTGITIWRAGIYPNWLGGLLIAGMLLGLLTVGIVRVPEWLGNNIASVGFTLAILLMGLMLMARSTP